MKAGTTTTAGTTTVLRNKGAGPALKLKSRSNAPSLAVTSRKMVKRLNADLLDGRQAAELVTRTHTYAVPRGGTSTTTKTLAFPGLPAGTYLLDYAITLQGGGPGLCYLRHGVEAQVVGLSYVVTRAGYGTAAGSAIVSSAAGTPALTCRTDTPFVFDDTDSISHVSFTETLLVDRGVAMPASRPAARGDGSGSLR